jgi:hypothetical protein
MQSGTAVNLIEWDNIKCGITEGRGSREVVTQQGG